jgi:hypothetical protein
VALYRSFAHLPSAQCGIANVLPFDFSVDFSCNLYGDIKLVELDGQLELVFDIVRYFQC